MQPVRFAFIALIFGSLLAATAEAQQGGSAIRGRVTDPQQAVLPGVAITVTHAESGTVRETVSGPDGSYLVPGLLPGPYHVAAELAGFSRLVRENIVLRIGTTLPCSSCASVAGLISLILPVRVVPGSVIRM